MIDFSGVTIELGTGARKQVVLDDVSIVLPTDRRLALLGHHGSGKSTIIQAIAGLILPSAGRISRYSRVSFPVGFGGGFNPALTLRQNLSHLAGIYGADAKEITNFVIQTSDTLPFLDEKLSRLPRDARFKLSFTVGYAIPFDVYLFDNFIAIGDPAFREKCFAMWNARAETSGMILATRDIRVARRWADIGAIIDRGKIRLFPDLETAIAEFAHLKSEKSDYDQPPVEADEEEDV